MSVAWNQQQSSGITAMERRRFATLKPFLLGVCLGFLAGLVVCVAAFVILFLM
jgi:hypothetical protein